jgi:hypothetical protein
MIALVATSAGLSGLQSMRAPVFEVYLAMKALRLNPVRALHYE